ncbi:hypothetical protein FK531_21045 [Rhodococcus spelaei]|uniref:Uncharacterized protein n=1 Tax=Rhodococcus spelaei TaxID=2546320 RepID=A0A541AZT7_9NOCA|nr:hypothetical protein [Rhodococcus spelaei]TQF65587.1 hypothetical protein FK531_21045 [Rhodococcus spelaei]
MTVPAYGDMFPKLLLVDPSRTAEPRLLRALHLAGIATAPVGGDITGLKLFGACVVADPAEEWDQLRPWVRAVLAFGADAWNSTLAVLSVDGPRFAPGASVTSTGDRTITVLGCTDLRDDAPTDSMLADALSSAQDAAGLSWGCGGSSAARFR